MVKFRVRESKPEPEEPVVEWSLDINADGDVVLQHWHDGVKTSVLLLDHAVGAVSRFSIRKLAGVARDLESCAVSQIKVI